MILTKIDDINLEPWRELVATSPTATWFQTKEAYDFYSSVPNEMEPFIFAVKRTSTQEWAGDRITGLILGYVTRDSSSFKNFFPRRAIIVGGPLLADDITDEELTTLLNAVRNGLKKKVIYIETRNFNSFEKWKERFIKCGFEYQPHLNFHVDTTSMKIVDGNLGKGRKRDIKTSFRDGVTIIEHPTMEQVYSYYELLRNLYATKVKTPLFSRDWFERLYQQPNSHFLLIECREEIVGGTILVSLPNRTVYEWFVCGRDGEWKSIFPSSCATYAGLKYAAEHGVPRFDMMGAGKPDEEYGVRDFKARFGGTLVEHGRFSCVTQPMLYTLGKLGVKLMKKL